MFCFQVPPTKDTFTSSTWLIGHNIITYAPLCLLAMLAHRTLDFVLDKCGSTIGTSSLSRVWIPRIVFLEYLAVGVHWFLGSAWDCHLSMEDTNETGTDKQVMCLAADVILPRVVYLLGGFAVLLINGTLVCLRSYGLDPRTKNLFSISRREALEAHEANNDQVQERENMAATTTWAMLAVAAAFGGVLTMLLGASNGPLLVCSHVN